MVAKVAVLLFAIVAVSYVQGAPQYVPFEEISNIGTGIRETVGDAAEQASNSFVSTFDSQKESIDNAIDSIKGVGEKGVEAGANIIKTGLQGIFLPLSFFRNSLAYGRNN